MIKHYRINHYIRVPQVRVIDADGANLGILPTHEALKKARDNGLDLVEVAAKADPPVCRIINFKKFTYSERQKEAKGRTKTKGGGTKELRIRPFIGPGDLEQRINRARKFLAEDRIQIKFTVQFRGREITRKEIGREKLDHIIESLSDVATIEDPPQLKGRFLGIILKPK